jgi:CDP-diacylglycerol--serine O-phosphatidyltransferase
MTHSAKDTNKNKNNQIQSPIQCFFHAFFPAFPKPLSLRALGLCLDEVGASGDGEMGSCGGVDFMTRRSLAFPEVKKPKHAQTRPSAQDVSQAALCEDPLTESPKTRPVSLTLRYLAPNAVTALSLLCSVMAIQAALRDQIVQACWWIAYSTLTDKLDGYVARRLNASSPLGVQMDSLADLLNYGFCPSAVVYAFFHHAARSGLGWSTGLPSIALSMICAAYTLCAALRLARFNVSAGNPEFFFGVPTTFSGGFHAMALATLCKYGNPDWFSDQTYPGWRLLGSVRLDEWAQAYPLVLLLFGFFMVSSWRMPKFGKLKIRPLNQVMIGMLVVGYILAALQLAPEFLIFGAMLYLLVSLFAHFLWTPKERPEPFFPI